MLPVPQLRDHISDITPLILHKNMYYGSQTNRLKETLRLGTDIHVLVEKEETKLYFYIH